MGTPARTGAPMISLNQPEKGPDHGIHTEGQHRVALGQRPQDERQSAGSHRHDPGGGHPVLPERLAEEGDGREAVLVAQREAQAGGIQTGGTRRRSPLLGRAAASTVEALMYSLRRGVNELTQPDTQRRLSAVAE